MTETIQYLSRRQIDTAAWDACVTGSAQRIVYGYSWYLDAVLPSPDWRWAGLVIPDSAGGYQTVIPIPLRRKMVAGIPHSFVVHQPFFCQILGIFSADPLPDSTPFYHAIQQQFRYGSTLNLTQSPGTSAVFDQIRTQFTLTLDLSVGYDALFNQYSRDRQLNLRRAEAANWTIINSTDPDPLVALFRFNHAPTIGGGVSEQTYTIFRRLYFILQERGLATLQYALREGRIEAGALFVHEGGRVIYLFNAASSAGRKGNARTLLIDRMIRQKASDLPLKSNLIFDFESPEKRAIADFYHSFGASPQPYWTIRWNRLRCLERWLLAIKKSVKIT